MSREDGTSVQEIAEELNELISVASELKYIDIGLLVRRCKDSMNKMIAMYEQHPEETYKLDYLKLETEIAAVQLEFYVQCRIDKYRDRYKLRAFTTIFNEDVKHILHSKCQRIKESGDVIKPKDDVNVDALKWVDYFKFATRLKMRSNHLVFNLTNDDELMIKLISNEVKEYKKAHAEEFGGMGI